MKIRNTIALSTLVLAAVLSGSAAANLSTGSIGTDVQSAIGTGSVSVRVNDGVATLFGITETKVDSNAAERAAANFEGIDSVINLVTVTN
ncbi:MAG: BON domain-containing protein [Granulosicoccus sp.]|nr:BON domain-containing protein [Granulosicoccus sp.]